MISPNIFLSAIGELKPATAGLLFLLLSADINLQVYLVTFNF